MGAGVSSILFFLCLGRIHGIGGEETRKDREKSDPDKKAAQEKEGDRYETREK